MNKTEERGKLIRNFNSSLFKIITRAVKRRPKDAILKTLQQRVDLVAKGSETLIIEQVGPILVKHSSKISACNPDLFTKDLIKTEFKHQMHGIPDMGNIEKFVMDVFDVVKDEVNNMTRDQIKEVFNDVNEMLLIYISYLELEMDQ